MVTSCNRNGKTVSEVRNYQGGGLVKTNTFELWVPIGTMVGAIVVDIVYNFIDHWVQEITEYESISWETITGEGIFEKTKSNVL